MKILLLKKLLDQGPRRLRWTRLRQQMNKNTKQKSKKKPHNHVGNNKKREQAFNLGEAHQKLNLWLILTEDKTYTIIDD